MSKILERVRRFGNDTFKPIVMIDYRSDIDQKATQEMKVKEGMGKYLELKHDELELQTSSTYFRIEQIRLRSIENFTCPLKTVAIFCHNKEFSYADIPEVVS